MNKITDAKIELLELLQEHGDFRDNFEKGLWEIFLDSRDLTCTYYEIYYSLSEQRFSVYEHTGNDYYIGDDKIYITKIESEEWESLHCEYEETKKYIENTGDEIAYNFEEWVEKEIKSDYIDNIIDSLIERLQKDIIDEKKE